jgi:poly(3-hydroxybutyrate) depolymerase
MARRARPWSCRLCTTVMRTRPFPSRWSRCQRGGMSRPRIADLQLRGNTSALPVRVYWPGQAASHPVPLLVFCIVGTGAGPQAEAMCRRLSEDPGLLVLAVSCPAGAQDGTTVLEWAAEHATELGADPCRLLVAGQSAGGAVATAVARQARAARWPEVMLATGRNDADLSEAVRRSLASSAMNIGGLHSPPSK